MFKKSNKQSLKHLVILLFIYQLMVYIFASWGCERGQKKNYNFGKHLIFD
jgi:hypothetical protein